MQALFSRHDRQLQSVAAGLSDVSEHRRRQNDRSHEWNGNGKVIENWLDLTLTDGHYRCPKCDKLELRFGTNVGGHDKVMWD